MISPVPSPGYSPAADTMEALRFILADSLTEAPKRRRDPSVINANNPAWVFVAGPEFQPVAVRTYVTLEKKMSGVIYFTPNTFYTRKQKDKASLRWFNCFFADIDDKELCLLDVLERVRYAGLPELSIMNRTPHGWHVFWKIQRVRATEKAVLLYEALQRKIADAIGADPKAASAEHFCLFLFLLSILPP